MNRRIKTWWTKLKIRLGACWIILFSDQKYWVLLSLDTEALMSLVEGDDSKINVRFLGIKEHLVYRIAKRVAKWRTETEMVVEKMRIENSDSELLN